MDSKDAIRDIKDIKSMMERSSRFVSISGWGVAATGIIAIVASWVAYRIFSSLATPITFGNTKPGLRCLEPWRWSPSAD